MFFCIDVRRKICDEDRLNIQLITLKTEMGCLLKDVEDEEICIALNNAIKNLTYAHDKHVENFHKKLKEVEKDFIKDVLENKEFYSDFIKEA